MKHTALTTLLLALLISACSGGGQPPGGNPGGKVASISLTPETATTQVGKTQTFTATGKGSSGNTVNTTFDWRSSNPQVATVLNGKATGLAVGTTDITASAGGVMSNAATLTVNTTGGGGGGGDAQPLHDTIAYATGDGDEIRLVNPDGSNDRSLWRHNLDDPEDKEQHYAVWSMSWKPDATELAFASTHERECSLFSSNIFAVGSDGEDYRRISEAPACADLAEYPKGTVRVPVRNDSFVDSFSGFLYFQGAPSAQPVNLPPRGTGVVTFENVADFGDGEDWLQLATLSAPYVSPYVTLPDAREILVETATDVQAGSTITTPEVAVFSPSSFWEAYSPTWSPDGSRIGHMLNGISLWQLPAEPSPLELGSSLLAKGVSPGNGGLLAWGPTTETTDRLLYSKSFYGTGVYLVDEGSADAGETLLTLDELEAVHGLAWLPDGSGFVYAVTDGAFLGEGGSGNLFVYDFATEEATRVTSFVGDFAGQVSVSPDGETFVFERATDLNEDETGLLQPDLWLVNRDGSGLRLLIEDAYAPAWSW